MAIPGDRFVIDLSDDDEDNDNDNRNDVARKLAAGSLIGEIKERTPKTPSAPVLKSTATGFPVPKNRIGRSAFKQQRQNNQSAHVARTTTTNKQTSSPQVESLEAEEKRIIDEENKQRLASMSEAEIAQEKAELMANLSPSLIERLLRRANIDDEQDQTPISAPREEASGTDLSGNKSKDKTKSVSFETSASESLPRPTTTTTTTTTTTAWNADIEDRPPAVHPADLRPASEIPSGPIHFPTPPPRQTPMPNLDPTSPSFYDDLQTHYFPDTPHDSAMLSWLKPREESVDVSETDASRLPAYHPASSTTQIVPSAIRFSFRGEMLPPSTSLELPTSLGLHHHADDPEAAGYTISELSILSRSIVPAQRCVAWQVLGRILFRLGMGEFGPDDSDLADGLWKVIELEGVVSRMLEEAEGGPQRTDQEGESYSAGRSNIGRHASAKAWAVEGIWLWQKGGGKRGITTHS